MNLRGSNTDILVLIIVTLNGLAGPVWDAVSEQGWAVAATGLFGVNAVVWIALGLAALQYKRTVTARDAAIWPVLIVGGACLIPSAQAAWAAGACWFAYRITDDRLQGEPLEAGHLIALALCARTPATWLLTTLLAEPLLQFDAVLAGWLAGLTSPITAIDGNIVVHESGHRLFVMTGCSSWNNLSLALLFWFSMTRGLLPAGHQPPLWHGTAVGVAVVLINIVRLSFMARSPENYRWLHDGSGADVVLAATAVTVATVTWLSLRGGRHAPLSA